tara:strand:+ start:3388 stop:3624 length:237 start_codon:yes stop_codon:yes gene_type:complete
MPYDKTLDKAIFQESAEFETTKVTVSVMSYNEGTPKLQLSRENLDQNSGEWRFSKLGRMFKDEAEKVLPLIQKALEKM